MTDSRKEFGKKLIEIRENRGLRQADVARIVNLSERSIGRLERGEIYNPSIDSLIELSKIYYLDILTLYKKYIYGDFYILEEVMKSLDINAMFLTNEIRRGQLEKIKLIKESRELLARKYDILLLELFLEYLNSEITSGELSKRYEDLTSTKIKRKNFETFDLSDIELRILLNIATTSLSFKGINRLEIFEKCKNQNINSELKILSINNLANLYYRNGYYEKAIKILDNGIDFSRNESNIYGLLYLYFIKFTTLFTSYKDYTESLNSTLILLKNINNEDLKQLIYRNIQNILKWDKN